MHAPTVSHDPKDGAIVQIFWQPRPAPLNYPTEVERGSYLLTVRLMGPGEAGQRTIHRDNRDLYKKINIRGREAFLREIFTDEEEIRRRGQEPWRVTGDENTRLVTWFDHPDQTRTIIWELAAHSIRHTEGETLAVIEEAVEVFP